jgi:hypothetical protein
MQLVVLVLGVRGTSVASGYIRVTLLAKDEVSADAAQEQGKPVLLLLPYSPLPNTRRIELELALWENAAGRHHMKASGEVITAADDLPDSEDDADAVWYTLFDEDTPAGEVCMKLWLAEHDSTPALAEQQQQAHTTTALTAEHTAADEADAEDSQAMLFDADGAAADVQAAPFDADESSLFEMSQDTSRTGTAVSFGSDDNLALQGVIHAADQQLLAATKTLTPHREAAAAARAAAATAADVTATSGFFNADDLSSSASLFMTGFLDGDTVDDTDVIAAAEASAVDLSLLHDGAFDLTAALRRLLPRYTPGSARLEVRASSIAIASTATAVAAPLYLRVTVQPGAQAMARSGDAPSSAVPMTDTAAQQWQQHTLPGSAPLSLPVPSSAAAASTLTSRSGSSSSSKRDRPPTLKLEAVGQRSIAHCEVALSQLLRAPDTCLQRSALPLLSRTSSADDASSGSMLVGSLDVQFRVVVQGNGQRGSVSAASARKRSRNNSLSAATSNSSSNSSSVACCAVVTVCVNGVRSSSSTSTSSSSDISSDTAYCTLAAELLCSGARSSQSLSSSSSATVCLALESTDVELDVLSLCLAQSDAPSTVGIAVGTAAAKAAEALYIPVADIAAIWGSEQGSAKWIALPARSQRSSSNNNSSSVRRNTNSSNTAAAGADAGQHTVELLLWVGVHSDSSIAAAATATTAVDSSPVNDGATSTALRLTAANSRSNGNRLSTQGGRKASHTAAGLQQHRRLVAAATGVAAAAAGGALSHSGSVTSHTTAGSSQMQRKRVRIALASPPPPPGTLEVEVRPGTNCCRIECVAL